MRAGVEVLRLALEGAQVGLLGQLELAALELDVRQLEVVVSLVEQVDLLLKLRDALALVLAGQLEAGGGVRRRAAIDHEEVEDVVHHREQEDEGHPDPFLTADGVDEHPAVKGQQRPHQWLVQPA